MKVINLKSNCTLLNKACIDQTSLVLHSRNPIYIKEFKNRTLTRCYLFSHNHWQMVCSPPGCEWWHNPLCSQHVWVGVRTKETQWRSSLLNFLHKKFNNLIKGYFLIPEGNKFRLRLLFYELRSPCQHFQTLITENLHCFRAWMKF